MDQKEIKDGWPCYWCGKLHNGMFWACERCRPLKEEGYRRARENGSDYAGTLNHVWNVLEENGIKPVPPLNIGPKRD